MTLDVFTALRAMNLPEPRGVLQVGASYGQELATFQANGIASGVFIEPLGEPFNHLAGLCKQIPDYVAVQALCTDESAREYDFYLANNGGMSSSILKPANHLEVFDYVKFEGTQKIVSSTLDEVTALLQANNYGHVVENADLLYMDTQGAELRILMGANRSLKRVKYIFTEIMRGNLYEGQAQFLSFCAYLDAIGYTLNNMYFNAGHAGDAVFIRKDVLGLS